ncbi:hypothetical protein BJY04DRAFT_226598 [Aspergillus karnatakaensis]|uniref:uncharacterized protein n=1 Tax=Aspergillus karnatakaensis TaxID=1810916 RepID=UPI003CCCAC1A
MKPVLLAALALTAAPVVPGQTGRPGTFANPASNVRPRFRYWLPDASVDSQVVANDIAAAASIGAGGVEFLPFFEYGGTFGGPPANNWSTYNFGTPAFVNLFQTALEAHAEHGLVMDFALGPNQGQGVPAEPDNEGLQWNLVPFSTNVRGRKFEATIPGWGTGELVAVVTALVKATQNISEAVAGLAGPETIAYSKFTLDHRTLTERTQGVNPDGRVALSFPSPPAGSHYRVFAFYERLAGYKNLVFPSERNTSIFDHGSFAVDHFDAKGAAVVRDFWKDNILNDQVSDLLARVGNYAWEDSLEMHFNVTWSRSLPPRFHDLHGYRLEPYLPLLTFRQNSILLQPNEPGPFECVLDTKDKGMGYINDFRAALVAGYQEYLGAMAHWVHNTLRVQLSTQPAYGSVMDMLAIVPIVDAPECESLTFRDNVDLYRAFSGPARLTGKRVVSNEMGAVRDAAYRYHLPELLVSVNRAFVGGINQLVLHGQSYSGAYPNTTWPGHTPFSYLFSDSISPNLPIWNHGLREVLDYIGRAHHILQNSVSKADVVIYHKQSATTIEDIYQADDLRDEGWSWNYLSSDNLSLREAKVQNRLLARDGPAWKAFIVESSQNLTLDAVRALTRFSRNGLPVIFSGGVPGFYATGDRLEYLSFKRELAQLLQSRNVHQVASGKVTAKLKALKLRPRVELKVNGTAYTSWSEGNGIGYAVVYSDIARSTGSITVASTDTPYLLNPWTGETAPLLIYERTKTTITIPINIAGNQTLFLAFSNTLPSDIRVPAYSVTEAPPQLLAAVPTEEGKISLHIPYMDSPSHIVLSSEKQVPIDTILVPPSIRLPDWNLTVEHWEAPEDMYNLTTAKRNTTHQLTSLASWTDTPELANTSGVGFYATTFNWSFNTPRTPCAPTQVDGAYLSFSRVVDSIAVTINNHQLPPIDLTNPVVDITPYLHAGENTMIVTVPTTLWNYLRTILDKVRSAGGPALPLRFGMVSGPTEAGLMGSVSLIPYQSIVV